MPDEGRGALARQSPACPSTWPRRPPASITPTPPKPVPFGTKTELSQSQTNDKGKILASSFVKAPAERGQSNMTLSQVAESEMKDATDEVQQDRIPRGSWKAVKGYFDTLKTDQTPAK